MQQRMRYPCVENMLRRTRPCSQYILAAMLRARVTANGSMQGLPIAQPFTGYAAASCRALHSRADRKTIQCLFQSS
jgi:hypothetical protein